MAELPTPKSFFDIPGWFWWLDRKIFSAVLESQVDSAPGTVVELGAYLGKSAVIIGDHVREGERFVVVDLFGDDEQVDDANRDENAAFYPSLTRRQFERNYLALHDHLPEVVQAPSSEVLDHVEPGSARFVHVDASHLYEQVRGDALAAKTMLRPGGVVVFDDYRAEHTPGVAVAVWQGVFFDGLIPVALTPRKLYGVYDDPEPIALAIRELVKSDDRFWSDEDEILGHPVIRVAMTDSRAALDGPVSMRPVVTQPALSIRTGSGLVSKPGTGLVSKRPPARPTSTLSAPRRLVRRVAREYAPSNLTRWVVARRRH